ncbi:MAG: arylsulfate sulfotransferase [Sulfurimonas sp.]|jgi:arylsulfate sulfotransferase
MKLSKILASALVASIAVTSVPTVAMAMGGASGAKLTYRIKGQLGPVIMDKYGIAPLTAIIDDGGYTIKNAKVTIVPKKDGQTISYDVRDSLLKQHNGIPVFGLYADYLNTVNVEYTKMYKGKEEKIKDTYKMYTPPVTAMMPGNASRKGAFFSDIEVKVVDPKYNDRLYFVNNLGDIVPPSASVAWNNPMGGALEWSYPANNFVLDTKGEIRWFMKIDKLYDPSSIDAAGPMMGFKQAKDGDLAWGWGQRYAKYSIMGNEAFNRHLPASYIDFSHSLDISPNGHYFMRVADANYKRADGKNVRTVRDVIVEVDKEGHVVEDWKLFQIMDPFRDVVLKAMDQGAVCLNVDASQAGHTMSEEEILKMDSSDHFGDITGVGPGRNWAHVNSVDHDAVDDAIIVSSRHQNAVLKIGRDKKIKWILGSKEGWKKQFQQYLLTPIDKNGKKIDCGDRGTECPGYVDGNGGFDWTYTQHTAYNIDSMRKGDVVYVSVFDNGDARGNEQPAMAMDKYSRAVIYKIDQKKMTVEQVWEFGQERGISLYAPVTSKVEYQTDKNSVFSYFATSGIKFDEASGGWRSLPSPTILEFDWMSKKPAVEIQMKDAFGYQAMPFSLKKAFE